MTTKKDKTKNKSNTKERPSVQVFYELGAANDDADSKAKEVVVEGDGNGEPTARTALPVVSLEVFCGLSGKKPDQVAGFKRYAKNTGIGPLTIPEWREELGRFDRKPIR